jgi:AraC family transcriptional regulator
VGVAAGPAEHVMLVESELRAPVATAQLVRFQFPKPIDSVLRDEQQYRLDLCLTPRPGNARARFADRWQPGRFEPIGDLFLVPPGESMIAVSDGCCQQASIVCQLQPGLLRECLDDQLQWTDQSLVAGLDVHDANIRSLMLRLAQEARNPGFASQMLVELIAAQLAIELTRYSAANSEAQAPRGLAAWRLRVIDERLQELGAPPTLSELAALCRLSVRQLTRGFRVSRECSIGDYVADNRIQQARQLLAAEESIKAVAYTLGFASPSSFCFAFRRATGEAPGQFRQRQQGLR